MNPHTLVRFRAHDPRAGAVARLASERARVLIAAGAAYELGPDELALPGADADALREDALRGLKWSAAVCIASGPSLTAEDCELVRRWRAGGAEELGVIVVNTSFRMAPWADVLYAMDRAWWKLYFAEARRECAGAALVAPFGHFAGVLRTEAPRKQNSGAGALSLAAHLGARRIVLLGYDCQATGGAAHWHADHPVGLGNARSVAKWPEQFRAMSPELAGREVLNCSRQSALDAFPRMNLEDVLCSTPGCRDLATISTSAPSSAPSPARSIT